MTIYLATFLTRVEIIFLKSGWPITFLALSLKVHKLSEVMIFKTPSSLPNISRSSDDMILFSNA